MKVTRIIDKAGRYSRTVDIYYLAVHSGEKDWIVGYGKTPAAAVRDMRHEYRIWNDSAEQGKCSRYH